MNRKEIDKLGGLHSAKIILYSVEFAEIISPAINGKNVARSWEELQRNWKMQEQISFLYVLIPYIKSHRRLLL